jgi:hypothetical protein
VEWFDRIKDPAAAVAFFFLWYQLAGLRTDVRELNRELFALRLWRSAHEAAYPVPRSNPDERAQRSAGYPGS